MAKRLVDIVLSALGLLVAVPVLFVAAIGILASSRGPIFHRSRRTGRRGVPFTMYKLRTMHVDHGTFASRITAKDDPRVFRFGAWLRLAKIDEFPQLINVLRGEMSVVGPRPEHPEIVRDCYEPAHLETLRVRPGLSSVGTLFDYIHGEELVGHDDPEGGYTRRLLPIKLALDLVYMRRASLRGDLDIIGRTLWMILARLLGRRRFPEPPEMLEAHRLLSELVTADASGEMSRQRDAIGAASNCVPVTSPRNDPGRGPLARAASASSG
jgi:lipopolysaccharide/colanic/teichoic acid biosynthesis glycosyltransferase